MNLFLADELPYTELLNIGIDKNDFMNLPIKVLDRLMTGRLSPLLKLRMSAPARDYEFIGKIAFERDKGKNTRLKVFPIKKEIDKGDVPLTGGELQRLKDGRVVKKRIPVDGKKVLSYIQLDCDTNNLISANVGSVYIPERIFDYSLSPEEIEKIKSGEPLEIEAGGEKITVGVDMEAKSGITYIKGTLAEWRLEKLVEWDRVNPQVTGFWCTSENGWQYQQEIGKLKNNIETEKVKYSNNLKY